MTNAFKLATDALCRQVGKCQELSAEAVGSLVGRVRRLQASVSDLAPYGLTPVEGTAMMGRPYNHLFGSFPQSPLKVSTPAVLPVLPINFL